MESNFTTEDKILIVRTSFVPIIVYSFYCETVLFFVFLFYLKSLYCRQLLNYEITGLLSVVQIFLKILFCLFCEILLCFVKFHIFYDLTAT